MDNAARTVTLLGTQAYALDAYNKSPKIRTDHPKTSTKSVSTRSLPKKDLVKTNAGRRCVSCHDPHASQAAMLLR